MHLAAAHWVYLIGVVSLIGFMVARKGVVVPAIIATFLTAWVYTGDFVQGIGSVFSASAVAITEFLNIFLVLAAVMAMVGAMKTIGAEQRMIAPIARLMKNSTVSYFVLFGVTYLLSMVFWPTPALALVAPFLLPAAIRAGLSPLAAAMALAIAGQGMALASDYVIGVAPSLSASGAGVSADLIANRALILSWVVGAVAITLTYVLHVRGGGLQRLRRLGTRQTVVASVGTGPTVPVDSLSVPRGQAVATKTRPPVTSDGAGDGPAAGDDSDGEAQNGVWTRLFAIIVPIAFAGLIAYMLLGKFTEWVPAPESGNGAALVGGLALILTLVLTLTTGGQDRLAQVGEHFVDGLVFAFRAMGAVIPVAGFVLIGIADFAGRIMLLPEDATPPSILFDIILSGERFIPDNQVLIMFAMLVAGMLIGLDGSGWTGLPFTGGLADALAHSSSPEVTATFAAIAQNAAGWTGGGTLIIWSSLVAVAGFTEVPVTTLVRRLFLPVVAGLILSVVVAALIW
ncbi:permease [Mycobacterium sp. 21AC1]|uniref:permease n=1 Tax=[Mycobacterium] appelbergii TaxID=2939269 RepID=UPI00293928E8|nr:permease [Mycobacterium sp. 21AC1]MDV3127554.1 permease [Mycobacterium sp. 21AC1]